MKGLKIARETNWQLRLPVPYAVIIDNRMPRNLIDPRQQPTLVPESAKPSLHSHEDLLRKILHRCLIGHTFPDEASEALLHFTPDLVYVIHGRSFPSLLPYRGMFKRVLGQDRSE